MVTFAGCLPFEVVACNIFYAGRLHHIFPVRADKALMKDVLTCTPLTPSTYKSCHPDDTDDPDAVGGSSEDEAEGLEEVPGVSRHLQKPPWPEPTLEPTPTPTPVPSEEEGVIKVQKRDLKRSQSILKDILAGRKIRTGNGASCEDVPFQVPIVEAGDKDCSLCHQSFSLTKALRHHMKTHMGEKGGCVRNAARCCQPGPCLIFMLLVVESRISSTIARPVAGTILQNKHWWHI